MMTGSFLLTGEVAAAAVELVLPSFTFAVERGQVTRPAMHVVVMNPTKRPEQGFPFEQAVLYEASFGDAEKYVPIARSKAAVSWRYRMYTQVVQQLYPHLLVQGMTKWGGGVYLHEIPVGASGVQYQMDQWFAEMVACTCRALCVGRMRGILENDAVTFLGCLPE